ncbi:malate dehydrogenase [Hydrocoleum sp. CS-953]|uniref:malate dehydrogenase n=1 Tax=Hydrocoleum sp. CS-953 TaxID=1671698 RepID=UPI000B9B4236|nr:malate dehydrogenase [Hydrocoleum sp. CS-953]OZH53390.1 malate dehydrogenase [Hydrocoleum sp. CS-953]
MTCDSTVDVGRVSIIGAGKVGSTLAEILLEKNIANVVLLDIISDLPQGIALDLIQAKALYLNDRQIIGTNDYVDTADSDIVVITSGQPRKPGMSRDELLKINSQIVVNVAKAAFAHSPNAIFIVVTNPLDLMTYLAWQTIGIPGHRVIGMGSLLDAARFRTFIAMELGISVANISGMVLGTHGNLMIPLPRYSTVNGIPITEIMDDSAIARIIERTRNGGAEIVKLMKTGSAYYAPAASTSLMIESILKNQNQLLPCSAYLQGQYGLENIFLGVPCLLGSQGVGKVLELDLTDAEYSALINCERKMRQTIEMAQKILNI